MDDIGIKVTFGYFLLGLIAQTSGDTGGCSTLCSGLEELGLKSFDFATCLNACPKCDSLPPLDGQEEHQDVYNNPQPCTDICDPDQNIRLEMDCSKLCPRTWCQEFHSPVTTRDPTSQYPTDTTSDDPSTSPRTTREPVPYPVRQGRTTQTAIISILGVLALVALAAIAAYFIYRRRMRAPQEELELELREVALEGPGEVLHMVAIEEVGRPEEEALEMAGR